MFKARDNALNREQPTYMEQLLRGEVQLPDIDDFVDVWHDAPGDSKSASQGLEEFLGMSGDEYQLWVERPESLRFIAAAHRQSKHVATDSSRASRERP